LASVPYAVAISRVFTCSAPRTADGTVCSGVPTPARSSEWRFTPSSLATATIFFAPAHGSPFPRSRTICAYTTFTESMVACSTVRFPDPDPSKLVTPHTGSSAARHPGGRAMPMEGGAGYVFSGAIPFIRAATRANGLNVEPAWRPVTPPVARLTCATGSVREKKFLPPTMALISPLRGSITVMAP
jgi:hypothetical protein